MGASDTLREVKVGCGLLGVLMPLGLLSFVSAQGMIGRLPPELMAIAGLLVLAMVSVAGMLLVRPGLREGAYVAVLGASVAIFCGTFLDFETIMFPIAYAAGGATACLLELMEGTRGRTSE